MRCTLHHIAIAAENISMMVDDLSIFFIENRCEMRLCYGHAHSGHDTLAQRASGGLDTGCQSMLGMAGSDAFPLTKVLDIIERNSIACEMQYGILQHRCVAT